LDLVITDWRLPQMDGMTDGNVLILEETGTGKEMVAKAMHHSRND
jgi:transcriptional regulator with GAF, ATPase, and Fis domain